MSEQIREVATRFVDVFLKYDWDNVGGGLKQNSEVQTLFDIVDIAGFCPTSIVLGRIKGHKRDQDGSAVGTSFVLNYACPYKVIGKEDAPDEENCSATVWLDDMVRRILSRDMMEETRDQLILVVSEAIKKVIPLEPIQITPDGDFLKEYPGRGKSTRDDDKLGWCIGVHRFCGGFVDRKRVTHTHDAIVCRNCYLRVLIPREVATYGDLRRALAPESK
jgi:hypothetical protein